MNELIVSVVKGDDGVTRVLIDRKRRGRKTTKVYLHLTTERRHYFQRLTWRNRKAAVPFFTEDFVGFTLYLHEIARKSGTKP